MITREKCRAVIEDIICLTRENYVNPDIGEAAAVQLQSKLDHGDYDSLNDPNQLAAAITADLKEITHDRHWHIGYRPIEKIALTTDEEEDKEARLALFHAGLRKRNYGFERVERLTGNIGYLDLRRFERSEYAGEKAAAAMQFLADCDALIFDLRKNTGGYPSMVQLITSYLFDPEPRYINSFFIRSTNETQQFWTFPHIPGKRRPDLMVYVLISNATGSAAEEFAYNLKQMDRAILVGETTLGAAHPVTREVVQDYFEVRLPYGKPINPITGENWEGIGVQPHIEISSDEALKTAHIHALDSMIGKCKEGEELLLTRLKFIVSSEYAPISLDEATLARFEGAYGKHLFVVENGVLVYTRKHLPVRWKLISMSDTTFRLDEAVLFEFMDNEENAVRSVKIEYMDGRPGVGADRI